MKNKTRYCLRHAMLLMIIVVAVPYASAQDDGADLYRVTTLRAAPGKWVELKALIEGQGQAGSKTDDGRLVPYRIRHSQGAQWDFMLIQPMTSLGSYFGEVTAQLEMPFRSSVSALADFEEDWVVTGPSHDDMKKVYPDAGMFLVEMFRARAGMKDDLVDSRVRENRVLTAINIPANFVFTGQFGADWDVMTIGLYESITAYATSGGGVSAEERDKAARDNGFDGIGRLAPDLRELLTEHSDTIASAME